MMNSEEANAMVIQLRKVLTTQELSIAKLGPIYTDINNIWRVVEKHYGTTLALVLLFQGEEGEKK